MTATAPVDVLPPSESAGRPAAGARLLDAVVLTGVLVGAIGLAAFSFGQFLETSRLRWGSAVHDRNAHYLFGLNLALDVRQADVKRLLSDLDGARTWPPLHGLLVAGALLIGGLDYRLAVLPSLAGWVITLVFGFLVARRMAPRWGNLAGLVAVAFIVGSPAHRVYATDIMLESLGAGLSLLALYLYLVASQGPSVWAQRGLGLALTALFLHKYNYWLLIAAALAGAELCARPRAVCRFLWETAAAGDWRRWARDQLRHPLTYLFAGLVLLLVAVAASGGQNFSVAGKPVSVRSPHNLLHLAYVILFIRAVRWWFRGGRAWVARLDPPIRRLLLWHGLPAALWFLLPKRLGYWLWYLAANGGEHPQHDLGRSVSFYASRFVADYHLSLGTALLATGLLAVALLTRRRLRPGAGAVLLLVVLATFLTVPHPNRKSRFLHSWIAAGWVAAGAGLVNLFGARALGARVAKLGPALAATAAGGIGLANLPGISQPGHSPERGHGDFIPASTCDLTDFYLPELRAAHRTMVFSTVDAKHMIRWTFLERYRRRGKLEIEIKGFGSSPGEDRRLFEQWLADTPCDTVVLIDLPPGTYFYEFSDRDEAFAVRLPEMLASQSVFGLARRRDFPRYGCHVAVYRRGPNVASTRAQAHR